MTNILSALTSIVELCVLHQRLWQPGGENRDPRFQLLGGWLLKVTLKVQRE